MIEWIAQHTVEAFVYFTMAIIFIIGVVQCILPLISINRAFNQALPRLSERTAQGAYLYDDPKFLKCKYLDSWWARYIFNLREMKNTNGDCDVLGFINSNTAIQSPSHSQFAELIPGFMTSLGVLGTFIGLVQGLSSLQVRTEDIAVLQNSIGSLIEGMSSAFYTSIAGVICAISFQLIRRLIISGATESLNRFILECQTVVSRPYTQDTKLIQTIYALLIEVRKSNEAVQQVLTQYGGQKP